jgi:hypothetical protein
MAISKEVLSGSTRGRGVLVAATSSTGTTIHTTGTSATTTDEIWLYATNNDTVSRNLTIEFGTTGAANEISLAIPAKTAMSLIMPGLVLRGDGSLAALFFTTSSPFKWLNIANVVGKTTITSFRVTDTNSTTYVSLSNANQFGFVAQQSSSDTGITGSYGASPLLFANGTSFTGTTRNDVYNLIDGRKVVVERGSTSAWGGTFRFGGYQFGDFDYNGKMQELIIYFSDKTSDRTDIETNIDAYYNVL